MVWWWVVGSLTGRIGIADGWTEGVVVGQPEQQQEPPGTERQRARLLSCQEVIRHDGHGPMTPAHGQPVIITLPAEIDIANVDTVGEQLAAALTPGTRVVIADMTATTFCDSMGIAMLIHAHKQATANGAELRLLLPCPDVLRVLRIHGVDAVLPIYHSLEEALANPG